jgi:hypothetical protein
VANGHGGYREPAHPAAVSGPGSFAKRTDGGPTQVQSVAPDQGYGDAQQQHQAESTAPMAGTNPLPPAAQMQAQAQPGQGGPANAQASPYSGGDFAAPSTRPNEPVTHGAPAGPGAGPEALSLGSVAPPGATAVTGQLTQMLQSLSGGDLTGQLALLAQSAAQYGV